MFKRYSLTRPFNPDGRHAYIAALPEEVSTRVAAGGCLLVLQEDGKELGPGDSAHQLVRDHGRGAYSFWGNSVWISASDNENCNENGRNYEFWLVEFAKGSALRQTVADEVVKDDASLMQIVSRNGGRNNSVFSNFFGYRHAIHGWLERAGLGVPRRMLELGCGNVPWTALRFLLEGTERYVANDIMKVRRTFPASEIASLKTICGLIDPQLLQRWSSVFPEKDGATEVAPSGLDVYSETGFETLRLADDLDFITSTSVLEHVMDPAGVYKKMGELIPSGGWMYHSIDLRDHRFFDGDTIAFLYEEDEEYAKVNTENRLRASEHVALLDQNGFDVVAERNWILQGEGPPAWSNTPEAIIPKVTPAMRETMNAKYRSLDLRDLSTIATQLLCKKR